MRNSLRVLLVGFTFLASIFAFAGLAGAQSDGSTTYVGSETVTKNNPMPQEAVLSSTATNTPKAEALAYTGSDSLVLVLAGGAAVVVGAGFLIARRRMAQA